MALVTQQLKQLNGFSGKNDNEDQHYFSCGFERGGDYLKSLKYGFNKIVTADNSVGTLVNCVKSSRNIYVSITKQGILYIRDDNEYDDLGKEQTIDLQNRNANSSNSGVFFSDDRFEFFVSQFHSSSTSELTRIRYDRDLKSWYVDSTYTIKGYLPHNFTEFNGHILYLNDVGDGINSFPLTNMTKPDETQAAISTNIVEVFFEAGVTKIYSTSENILIVGNDGNRTGSILTWDGVDTSVQKRIKINREILGSCSFEDGVILLTSGAIYYSNGYSLQLLTNNIFDFREVSGGNYTCAVRGRKVFFAARPDLDSFNASFLEGEVFAYDIDNDSLSCVESTGTILQYFFEGGGASSYIKHDDGATIKRFSFFLEEEFESGFNYKSVIYNLDNDNEYLIKNISVSISATKFGSTSEFGNPAIRGSVANTASMFLFNGNVTANLIDSNDPNQILTFSQTDTSTQYQLAEFFKVNNHINISPVLPPFIISGDVQNAYNIPVSFYKNYIDFLSPWYPEGSVAVQSANFESAANAFKEFSVTENADYSTFTNYGEFVEINIPVPSLAIREGKLKLEFFNLTDVKVKNVEVTYDVPENIV